MIRKYKISYRKVLKLHEVTMEACSKYDAKQRFYRIYPRYEIVGIEEVGDEKCKDEAKEQSKRR